MEAAPGRPFAMLTPALRSSRAWTGSGWTLGPVDLPEDLALVATDPSGAEVRRSGTFYRVDHPFGAVVRADTAARRFEFDPGTAPPEAVAHVVDNFVVPRLIAHDGALVLHAGLVDTPRGAIACCATSGLGKSTLAAGLGREGWTLMGDDAAILSDPDTRPRVRPTYRRLSLWEDSARALLGRHEPLGYKHEEDLAEPSDPGATRPLAALFLLERAGVAAPVHRALPPAAATMAIVANSFALDPAEPGFVRRRLAQAGALRDRVPVLAFDYPRRYDAFAAARAALARILEGLT